MGTTKNKGAPRNGTPSKAPRGDSNSAFAQRQRLLKRLRVGPLTTLDARRDLDVLHPAARVMELRQSGLQIETVWTHDLNGEGRPHRVALYILRPGKVVI